MDVASTQYGTRIHRWRLRYLFLLVAVSSALLYTASMDWTSSRPDTADDSALCLQFRNVSNDAAASVFPVSDLRTKLKDVYDNSTIATPQVRVAAGEMLASITRGDMRRFEQAVNDMDSSCSTTGN